MTFNRITLIYFSATGTTQKVLKSIADGIRIEDVEHINLTLPEHLEGSIDVSSNELVLIGAPVYGGRLPAACIERFKKIKADQTPAVPIVLYGNREFEDALLELTNLTIDLGFLPIAAGAFVGEHSFSTEALPIADGRPDRHDIEKAMAFGVGITNKLAALPSLPTKMDFDVPGRFPYEAAGARPMKVSPVTKEDSCTACGTCADVCPTAAITVGEVATTETERCIRCCACIKNCPEAARWFDDDMMVTITKWLYDNCSERKEPEFYGVEV